jgi:hypothetical protein
LLTTLCGTAFLGDGDGDTESPFNTVIEGVIVDSLVDESDDVVDAVDDDKCEWE